MSWKTVVLACVTLIFLIGGAIFFLHTAGHYRFFPEAGKRRAPVPEVPPFEVLTDFESMGMEDALNGDSKAAKEIATKYQGTVSEFTWLSVAAHAEKSDMSELRKKVRALPPMEQRRHQQEMQRILSITEGILNDISSDDVPTKYKEKAEPCFAIERSATLETDGSAMKHGSFTRCLMRIVDREPSQEGCDLLGKTLGNVHILADRCFLTLTETEVTQEICTQIYSTFEHDLCYALLAKATGKRTYCDSMSDESMRIRETCLSSLGLQP